MEEVGDVLVMRWCCWYWEVVGLARMAEEEEDRETTGAARVALVALVGAIEDEVVGRKVDGEWEEVVGEVAGEEEEEEECGRKRRVGERAI